MSLRSKLRDAEQYGAKAAHTAAEHVRTGVHNLEASLSALSSHRNSKRMRMPGSTHPDPEQLLEVLPAPKVRTGIISVNGRDVGEMRCTGGRGSA